MDMYKRKEKFIQFKPNYYYWIRRKRVPDVHGCRRMNNAFDLRVSDRHNRKFGNFPVTHWFFKTPIMYYIHDIHKHTQAKALVYISKSNYDLNNFIN